MGKVTMARASDHDRPDFDRPFLDYDAYREEAARMRAEVMNGLVSQGLSAVTPSRRTLRNFGLAVLLATGAFWLTMLEDPPKTIAADPSVTGFSPSDIKVPSGLPTAEGGNAS